MKYSGFSFYWGYWVRILSVVSFGVVWLVGQCFRVVFLGFVHVVCGFVLMFGCVIVSFLVLVRVKQEVSQGFVPFFEIMISTDMRSFCWY